MIDMLLSQELCQCFYQLKSLDAELCTASEKLDNNDDSDDDDDDDDDDVAEQQSNSEEEVPASTDDMKLNTDSSTVDNNDQLVSKPTRSEVATHTVLQQKIKDMMSVAHVSCLFSPDVK